MLIPCDRHTAADLAHWAQLEAGDLLYARRERARLERLRDETVRIARAFVAAGPCYVGCSLGKDSVLLASLLAEAGYRGPVVHVHAPGYETPFSWPVRDALRARYPLDWHELAVLVERDSAAHRGEHGRHDAGYAEAARRFGDRYISGVRRDESWARELRYRGHGASSARTCAPLSNWRNADVFAWCAREGLPLHPSYAMTAGGRWAREHLRVSSIGHARGERFGLREWERLYYRRELEAMGMR